jgi:hypothetical protein
MSTPANVEKYSTEGTLTDPRDLLYDLPFTPSKFQHEHPRGGPLQKIVLTEKDDPNLHTNSFIGAFYDLFEDGIYEKNLSKVRQGIFSERVDDTLFRWTEDDKDDWLSMLLGHNDKCLRNKFPLSTKKIRILKERSDDGFLPFVLHMLFDLNYDFSQSHIDTENGELTLAMCARDLGLQTIATLLEQYEHMQKWRPQPVVYSRERCALWDQYLSCRVSVVRLNQ